MDYAQTIAELRTHDPKLADEFQEFDSVVQVVDWLQERGLGKSALDVVSHDEFSYDLLIRLDAERWLVFGVN